MTKSQAINKLIYTKELTTAMLTPLGISFETFLKYAQLDKDKRRLYLKRLIKFYLS